VRILVTAGGTEEPVDGVRRLTNSSTGATGGALARIFAERGADVLLLHAERARIDDVPVERETFVSFSDLETALRRCLGERHWDAVVHLAAVSDYSVAAVEVDGREVAGIGEGKIPSGREVTIRLRPNSKLIDHLRTWSRNPAILVVGFKLTNDSDREIRETQLRALLDREVADLVVHNDLGEITAKRHTAEIWDRDRRLTRTETKAELATALLELLTDDTDPGTSE
jgi:phosphopantothenoylcysteine synthetase/decarboxylase